MTSSCPEEIDRLECRLSELAMDWRGSRTARNSDKEAQVRLDYHSIVKRLWDLEWRGYGMLPDMELPDEYMPTFYVDYWRKKRENSPPLYSDTAKGPVLYVMVADAEGPVGYLWADDAAGGAGRVARTSRADRAVDLLDIWLYKLGPAKAEGLRPSQALRQLYDTPARPFSGWVWIVPNSEATAPSLAALQERAAAE